MEEWVQPEETVVCDLGCKHIAHVCGMCGKKNFGTKQGFFPMPPPLGSLNAGYPAWCCWDCVDKINSLFGLKTELGKMNDDMDRT